MKNILTSEKHGRKRPPKGKTSTKFSHDFPNKRQIYTRKVLAKRPYRINLAQEFDFLSRDEDEFKFRHNIVL